MHKWQALLALLAVGAGSVLAASGPGGLARLGSLLLANAGWILLGLGVVALLSAIAPRGALLGPLVLILAGLVVLGWPRVEVWTLSGGVITVGGGLFLMRKASEGARNTAPVVRRTAMLLTRETRLTPDDDCPERLFLRAVLGKITADVRRANVPPRDILELMITCWGGWVEVNIPAHWTVVAGRLEAANLISFHGTLDHTETFPDPSLVDVPTLVKLTQVRLAKHGSTDQSAALVVVHVMGLGGGVVVTR